MRLKTVKIIGFKSFADKIVLDFQGDIVAIVGPNGCGKSNIVDAFRWVLGEQSAKSLRGDKMLDVIFAGALNRKSLNMAEVTVTLTDIGGKLPTQYEELSITRKLYRSGESEYFINQQHVRLRDIQSLLWDSGVGKNAFSIFEQGKLDQIIQLSPLERRVIFDEAAGIGRFRERKKESLRKLEQVSENKNRVKDVYGEVYKLAKALEKKSQQAQLFQEHKKEFEELEKDILFSHYHQLSKKHQNLSESQKKLQEELKEVLSAHQFLSERIQEYKSNCLSQEKNVKQLFTELQSLSTKLAIKRNELDSLKEGLKKGITKEDKLIEEARLLQEEFLKYEKLLGQYQELLTTLDEKRKASQIEIDHLRKQYKEAEVSINQKRETTKNLQKEHLKTINDEKNLSLKCNQEELRKRQIEEKRLSLLNEKEEGTKSIQKLETLILEKKRIVEEQKKNISLKKEELKTVEIQFFNFDEQLKKLDKDLSLINLHLAEITARKNSLERLKIDLEGFSQGVKKLLELSLKKGCPFYQKINPLYKYFSIKEGFEAIVALGLNRYKDTIVVEKTECFEEVLKYAEEHQIKNFSILCLEYLKPSKNESVKEGFLLKEYVHVSNVEILNLLEDVYVTSDLKTSLRHHLEVQGSEVVNIQGYMIDQKGIFFQSELSKGESNHFIRESEIKQLQSQIEKKRMEIEQIEKEHANLLQTKKEIGAHRLFLDQEMRKEEMNLVKENFNLQKFIDEKNQFEKKIALIDQDLERSIKQLSELQALLIDLNSKESEFKQRAQALYLKIQDDETSFHKDELFLKSRGKDRYEKDLLLQEIKHEFQRIQQLKTVLETKWHEQKKSSVKICQELEAIQSMKNEGKERIDVLEKELSSLSMEDIELKHSFDLAESTLAKIKQELSQTEIAFQKKDRRLAELERENQYSSLTLEQETCQKNELIQNLQERFNLSPIDIESKNISEINLPDAEKRAKELKIKLDKIGPVDFSSIEEYEEQKKRSDFFSNQLRDLEESEVELKKVIAQLEGESRKNFKKSFQRIKENFQKNFQILFQGGESDLQFTDSNDLLEAGVEIIAKPPGKQMRSISLLSGGEKCLTALALLFSIFEEKPAPFCILDEVDAPLDETNVDRFTQVLKKFKENTQFILITHNKKTMSNADILFGVSMEEKGVSKLISLAFEKKEITTPLLEDALV